MFKIVASLARNLKKFLAAWNLSDAKSTLLRRDVKVQEVWIPNASPKRDKLLGPMILRSKMLFTLWTVKSSGHALYVGHYSNIYTFAITSRPLSSIEMTGSLASAWRNSFVTVCWLSSAVIFLKFQCVDCLVQLGCWRQTVRPWWLCRKSRVSYVRSTKLWIAAAATVSVQLIFWKKPVINLSHCICVPCRPAFLLLPTLCWSVHFTEHLMTVRTPCCLMVTTFCSGRNERGLF